MTNKENCLLFASLLHHPELVQEAVLKLQKAPLVNPLADPVTALLWSAMRDTREAMRVHPTAAMLTAELNARGGGRAGLEAETVQRSLKVLHWAARLHPEQVPADAGRRYLEQALVEGTRAHWQDQARLLGSASVQDLGQFVTRLSSDYARLHEDQAAADKPLLRPEKYLVTQSRMPFGIEAMDLLAGGGIAGGEVFGLLGPTGGGKTVLAISLCCERARRRQHSFLFTYEQKTAGDIMERICTYTTGVPIDVFRDHTMDGLAEETQGKLRRVMADYGEYLTVIDLAQGQRGHGGAEEVLSTVERYAADKGAPSLVVIDWLGAMILRYIAFNNKKVEEYRHWGHAFIDRLSGYARKYQFGLVISHQLRTDAARRSPAVRPVVTDASEMRAFSYFMDACFCLGTLDERSRVGWLLLDKNRRGPFQEVLVRLNGPQMRFELAKGYNVDHRGRFVEEGNAPADVDKLVDSRIAADLRNNY